jgi:hypothetical protein
VMKSILALALCVAFVAAVPVAQVEVPKVAVAAPADVVESVAAPATAVVADVVAKVAEIKLPADAAVVAAVDSKAAVVGAVDSKAAVVGAVDTAVVGEVATKAVVAEATETAVTATKVATPVDLDAIKDQALTQVLSFIKDMGSPLNTEEHNALKDMISAGGDILVQAEKKAREVQEKLETSDLLQQDMFGMGTNGQIDPEAAADQVMNIVSLIAGPEAISEKERTTVHDIIKSFSKLFTPDQATTKALQSDLEKVMGTFTKSVNKIGSHDDLLNPQTLLSVFDESKNLLDTSTLSDLTKQFLKNVETEFDSVAHKLQDL